MSTTDNLLIIRLLELGINFSKAPTIQLHLANIEAEWQTAASSQMSIFMHPTKNIFLQLDRPDQAQFPIHLHSCPDLLTDFPCKLHRNSNLLRDRTSPLLEVLYVVTDEVGKIVPAAELRTESVYKSTFDQ